MDNQHFLDENQLKVENERPTFLTVLCIITFVVSGLMFLSAVFGAITYDKESQIEALEQTIVTMEEIAGDAPGVDNYVRCMEVFNEEQIENSSLLMILSILSTLLSLIGAFIMYRLRKTGFHIYLTSKVIGLVPLLFFTLSTPVFLTYGIFIFFTIAFVIMYSRNLKYMN